MLVVHIHTLQRHGRKLTTRHLNRFCHRVLSLAAQAPQICFGLGGMAKDSVLLRSGYLSEQEFDHLRSRGAVGDVLGRFVDENGQIVDEDLNARTVGLSLPQLIDHPCTMAVVAGTEKYHVTKAALRAKYLSILVTDEATAAYLLEET